LRGAVNQKHNGQESFTAAGAAANQGRPAFRQAAEGNLVEPCIPVGVLGSDAPGCSAFRVEILETLLGFSWPDVLNPLLEDLR